MDGLGTSCEVRVGPLCCLPCLQLKADFKSPVGEHLWNRRWICTFLQISLGPSFTLSLQEWQARVSSLCASDVCDAGELALSLCSRVPEGFPATQWSFYSRRESHFFISSTPPLGWGFPLLSLVFSRLRLSVGADFYSIV